MNNDKPGMFQSWDELAHALILAWAAGACIAAAGGLAGYLLTRWLGC